MLVIHLLAVSESLFFSKGRLVPASWAFFLLPNFLLIATKVSDFLLTIPLRYRDNLHNVKDFITISKCTCLCNRILVTENIILFMIILFCSQESTFSLFLTSKMTNQQDIQPRFPVDLIRRSAGKRTACLVLPLGILVLLHAQAEPHLKVHLAAGPSVEAVP